jgi:transposase
LWNLTGVWNWAVRKIELDAKNGIYHSKRNFQNLLADHGKTLGVPSHTLQGILLNAHMSWQRCFHRLAKKPKLKGKRNALNSIPFPDAFKVPVGNRIKVPGIGSVRFHKQALPEGRIKSGRIVHRASGWYLCLFVDALPNRISRTGDGQVGIDPGYKHLITLSTGEKIDHPRELRQSILRIGQAQRGNRKQLTARLHERIQNQRKDRNHKLSRQLVSENTVIVFSKDNLKGLSKIYGKSVADSGHGQLRSMLAYKCTASGRLYIEVPSSFSTRTCSRCGAHTGPQGRAGLSVRQWVCSVCGTLHDRDINAAINTLIAGLGTSHERRVA